MATAKPDLTRVWASTAPGANVVDPDVTFGAGKFESGWLAEIPPFQSMNYLQNNLSAAVAHFNEQGIPLWDANTTYPINALVKGSDGELYRAINEQNGNDPTSDAVNWLGVSINKKNQVATVDDMISDPFATVGSVYQTAEYVAGGGVDGGGTYDVISGTGTANGFDKIAHDTLSLTFVLRIHGHIKAKACGVRADDATDDYAAWVNIIELFKSTGFPIQGHTGISRVSDTIEYNTVGDGIVQGLVLEGAGGYESEFKNTNAAGGPCISLNAGTSASDIQYWGRIKGFRFTESASGANSHGIQYQGCWHQTFDDLFFDAVNGAGLRPINTAGDADASSVVFLRNIRAIGCTGAGFDSTGATGGLVHHKFDAFFAHTNGLADIVIEGMIHYHVLNCSLTGQGGGAPAVPGLYIKAGTINNTGGYVYGGEYGNNAGGCILIERASNLYIGGMRFVRRAGETNNIYGIRIPDNASTRVDGLRVGPITLDINDAAPVFTFLDLGTGMGQNCQFESPIRDNFNTTTHTLLSENLAATANPVYSFEGESYRPEPLAEHIESTAASTYQIDLANGPLQRITFTNATSFQLLAPALNGRKNGTGFKLILQNSSGATIVPTLVQAGSGAFVSSAVPSLNTTERTSVEFVFESASAKYCQIGDWAPAMTVTP